MPKNTSASTPNKIRSYDSESGLNRIKPRNKVEINSVSIEEESLSSDSDTSEERQMDMPSKDDTVRRLPKQKSRSTNRATPKAANHGQLDTLPEIERRSANDESTIGLQILFATSFHLEVAPITYPAKSEFIPYLHMPFNMLNAAQSLVVDNTHLRYLAPHYFTVATTLYYSYIFAYQILRAREAANSLTRIEKRVLTRLSIALKPETATIMGPLVGYVQSLGSIQPYDPMYNWIVPKFPNFASVSSSVAGLLCLSNVNGSSRFPCVPALMRILNQMTVNNKPINDGYVTPFTMSASDTTLNNWMSLDIRAATNANQNFRSAVSPLIYSAGWNQPPDYLAGPESNIALISRRIKDMFLPQVDENSSFNALNSFLCLNDDDNLDWLPSLSKMAAHEAHFFKGSTTLAAIAPTTTIGSFVRITKACPVAPSNQRSPGSATYPRPYQYLNSGYHHFGSSSREEMKIGLSTHYFVDFKAYAVPVGAKFEPEFTGPIFESGNPSPRPVAQYELLPRLDQTTRFAAVVAEMSYNPHAKQ